MPFRAYGYIVFFSLVFGAHASNIFAQQLSKTSIDSLANQGVKLIHQKEWGDALDIFDEIMDNTPDNLNANYYYAICQREIATTRNPVERILRWNSSERHLHKVLSLDSAFKDTYYQFAVLQSYRNKYYQAADLAKHQLKLNDTLSSALTGIFKIYDALLSDEYNDEILSYLQTHTSVYDKYFLGEYYRKNDELEKAEVIFDSLLTSDANLPKTRIYLSLVRLYIQKKQFQKAADMYWTALDSVKGNVGRYFIQKDFEYIMNGREYNYLQSHSSTADFKRAMKIFWKERNPLPSLPYNMRIIEHYSRMMYAEKYYRFDGFRLKIYDANKLEIINHPPWYYLNDKFNDRGVIYVRFGKPDSKSTTVGARVSNMSWLYYPRNNSPRMIFYFMIDAHAPPGYWTLVPGFTDPQILNDLIDWEPRFHNIEPLHSNIWAELMKEGVQTAERGLTTDSFSWPEYIKPLPADITMAQFKKDNDTNTIELDYAVPLSELDFSDMPGDSAGLIVDIAAFDDKLNPVVRREAKYSSADDLTSYKQNNFFIDGIKLPLRKDHYFISVNIRAPKENKLFGANFKYTVSDFTSRLSCSSLLTAFNISPLAGPDSTGMNYLDIIPNPTTRFSNSQNVYIYYEIYNLKSGAGGHTDYSVELNLTGIENSKSFWDTITGIFGSKKVYNISISNNYSGSSREVKNYLAIDISDLASGKYKLKMEVKDNISGEKTDTSSDLTVE